MTVARRWSLATRLGWRLAAVMLAAIALAGAAVMWRAITTVQDIDDLALQSQAALITAQLSADAAGPNLPEAVVAPFRASDGDNVFLIFRGERLVASSDDLAAADLRPLLPRPVRIGFFAVPVLPGHPHGMVGLATEAGPYLVLVLQGHEQIRVLLDSLLGHLLPKALLLLLPIGLLTVAVGVVTLRHGLRPLREVSVAAARVGPSVPGARLPTEGLPDEITPIVGAVNAALARLEQGLAAQRHFLAEAAHSMRTPLAVLTARLDMLDDPVNGEALRHDADRLGRLVGQLLRMARLEALPLDLTQTVDLRAVAAEAITDLAPLALRERVEFALHAAPPPAKVRGNHAALVLAVTNLLENALAQAPPGSMVEVEVIAPATIAVLDRGPGVAEPDRARIFGRFERGAVAPADGAGLGLAIVAEISRAHGGAVAVDARPGGGAAFTITFGAIRLA